MMTSRRVLAVVLSVCCHLQSFANDVSERTCNDIRVMTYNIRNDRGDHGTPGNWDERKDSLFAEIKKGDPDLLGMQEVSPRQMADLRSALSGFEIVGDHRDADRKSGEASPIAYRKSRFRAEKTGTFWLSETPDVPGSKSWGSAYLRICTYALLKDVQTGESLCIANTHTDNVSELARQRGLQLVLARIRELAPDATVVLTGDHNCRETDVSAVETSKVLRNALYQSETPPRGSWRSFNGWRWRDRETSVSEALALSPEARNARGSAFQEQCGGSRIDYIYVAPGVRVLDYETLNDPRRDAKQYPSDHFPVVATIRTVGCADAAQLDADLQRRCQEVCDMAVREGMQGALQFCAYKDGRCIVDVWAGTMTTNPSAAKIDGRSLFPIFSTEKPLLATAVHRAVEQGKMAYEKPLSTWWPEFSGEGKEKLTLGLTLGYRSGMPARPDPKLFKTDEDRCNWQKLCTWAASVSPELEPGTKQRYMSLSYGWYLGHPLEVAFGKPLNEVLVEQVLRPCGIEKEFYFSADDTAMPRIVTVYKSAFTACMNKECYRRMCLPSAYAVANARSIAVFYNRLCGFDGRPPLIRKETLDEALKPCRHETDPLPDAEGLKKWHMIFGMGYGLWGEADDMSRVFGHGGAGGSEGLCDRSQRLTVGYTCNFDKAPTKLREALYSIVGMRWRYRTSDVNIQDLQMSTVHGGK